MSKRPPLYLIKGGLMHQAEWSGVYHLRERRAVAHPAESWPRDGEWRRLIESLMGNPRKGK